VGGSGHERRRAVALGVTAVVLAPALALSGCGADAARAPAAPVASTPANGTVVHRALPASLTSLTFTDPQGRRVSLAGLHGKTLAVTDFLTTCAEICPMTSVNFRQVADAARRAGLGDDLVLIEITVDPERDQPARLAAYQKLFGAVRPNWTFLTADPADITEFWNGLGVAYYRQPPGSPPPTDWLTGKPLSYDVAHQNVVFLIDGQGRERWLVEGQPSTGGAPPPARLLHVLTDDGRQDLATPQEPDWTAQDLEAAVTWLTGRRLG
jgi:protein SCO1